jgi:uncharacterized protein YbjT (DUF2867 family)
LQILLTGANGFIGSHVLASLLQEGHKVLAAVRAPEKILRRFPQVAAVGADFNTMTQPEDWRPLLENVDAVINCAGVLRSRAGQNAVHVHATAPIALFKAAARQGVRKVIQMSAIGYDAPTEFARTKREADDYLQATNLDWTILRPSIVYGQQAYGGTAMLRALAAMPFAIPVIGKGDQRSTPIHLDDLCKVISKALRDSSLSRKTVYPCGPETMALREISLIYRNWLGLAPAAILHVPMPLIRLAAHVGDWLGSGPITTTSVKQLEHGTQCDPAVFERDAGFKPQAMAEALMRTPAGTADLWHARFYLLRPVVRSSLVLLWLGSALAGFLAPTGFAERIFSSVPTLANWSAHITWATSLLDLAIAAALAFNWRPRLMGLVQLAVISGYTLFLTVMSPSLWFAPFGELLKNVPILVLVAVSLILSEER